MSDGKSASLKVQSHCPIGVSTDHRPVSCGKGSSGDADTVASMVVIVVVSLDSAIAA
jgi:hypothetical protein